MGRSLLFALALLAATAARATDTCSLDLQRLEAGQPVDAVWAITHQIERLHQDTIRRLVRDPGHASLPVVLFNTPRVKSGPDVFGGLDPSVYPELRGRAVVRMSMLGETSGPRIDAATVHVAGGNCGNCLTRTVYHLIEDFAAGTRDEMRIVVHRSLVYGYEGGDPVDFAHRLIPFHLLRSVAPPENPHAEFSLFYRVTLPGQSRRRLLVEIVP